MKKLSAFFFSTLLMIVIPALAGIRDTFIRYEGPPSPKIYIHFYKNPSPPQFGPHPRNPWQPKIGDVFFLRNDKGGSILETMDGFFNSPCCSVEFLVKSGFKVYKTENDSQVLQYRRNLEQQESAKLAAEMEARREQQERKRAEEEAKENARAQKLKEMCKKLDSFEKRYNVNFWLWVVGIDSFYANPFKYEGEIIAFESRFIEMISSNEGLFTLDAQRGIKSDNYAIVTDIPTDQFSSPSHVIIAGQVIGKKFIKVPLFGEINVPHLKFRGAFSCPLDNCQEIYSGEIMAIRNSGEWSWCIGLPSYD